MGASELLQLYRARALSPVEVISAHLERIERFNPQLNAFISTLDDSALTAAHEAEALFRKGLAAGPLQGVPISLKDMIRVKGGKTTAASRLLMNAPPDAEDAALTRALRAAGAIILGKNNLHEFASGAPGPDSPYGVVQNPRRLGCSPGMSSSGSGAAVAAGQGVISVGTDTGGSVRIPAHFCGVVGLKPTSHGLDMSGIIPLSHSLDCPGFLARRVADVESAWLACTPAGFAMPTSTRRGTKRRMRIAILQAGILERLQPAVETAYQHSIDTLRQLGHDLQEIPVDGLEEMADITLIITQAEAAAYHERFRGQEALYGTGFLQNRLTPGRDMKAVDYIFACRRRMEFQWTWNERFRNMDALILPTSPLTAPLLTASTGCIQGVEVDYRKISGCFTRLFNCLGWPAITLPNGVDNEGLPSSIQIAAREGKEPTLIALAKELERAQAFCLPIQPRDGKGALLCPNE